jgi:protein TonB
MQALSCRNILLQSFQRRLDQHSASVNILNALPQHMNFRLTTLLAAGVLAGCGTPSADRPGDETKAPGAAASAEKPETKSGATSPSTAFTLEGYKRDLALRISQSNAGRVYEGRPQALLRSVIVLKYIVDSRGNLVRSEIMRSNRDKATEATALASLKTSAPFPKPLPHLLRNGRVEISETWLFNSDGRFQLRTIALPQMDE